VRCSRRWQNRRATEAFTVDLPGHRRDLAPVYSSMIATEPLSHAFWADAGLSTRPTFTDGRLIIIYGQRTADGRFAFGGRGTPYHFGSRFDPRATAISACSIHCTEPTSAVGSQRRSIERKRRAGHRSDGCARPGV
jgi:hypothetical protein